MNINRMTCNGTVVVNVAEDHTFAVGDSIRIWDAQSFSGTPTLASDVLDTSKGLAWDDSRLSEGLLFVVESKHIKGDVNEDGEVDISDVVAVINTMAGTAAYRFADVNGDGEVDISDIVAVINIMAGNKEE